MTYHILGPLWIDAIHRRTCVAGEAFPDGVDSAPLRLVCLKPGGFYPVSTILWRFVAANSDLMQKPVAIEEVVGLPLTFASFLELEERVGPVAHIATNKPRWY